MSATERAPAALTGELRRRALAEGFDGFGVAPAAPPGRDVRRLEAWLAAGRHASMDWMLRHRDARRDPGRLLPGCRHVVLVTLDYAREDGDDRPGRGRVARYARGRDYHRVFGKRLRRLAAWLAEESGAASRSFVDTGPVLERAFAERAGLGWIGKNACLIATDRGSWFVIGEILTAARLVDDDAPILDRCGSCTACLDACPTGALLEPGVVDSRRCVAYWTIEHRGAIDPAIRAGMGSWMFGCDDCQTVCPWNVRFARHAAEGEAFEPRTDLRDLDPVEVLEMGEAEFRRRFEGTPLMRARRDGLRRNACVVLGNLRDPEAVPHLAAALADPDPVIRRHAAWALGRIAGDAAAAALAEAALGEDDPSVRDEIVAGSRAISGS